MLKIASLLLIFALALVSAASVVEKHYHYHFDDESAVQKHRVTDTPCIKNCKNLYPLYKPWQSGNRSNCFKQCVLKGQGHTITGVW